MLALFALIALIASCGLVLAVLAPSWAEYGCQMSDALSPGQIERDAHYAAALWLLSTDPVAALAVLRCSHDTLPPAPQCESPISRVNPVHSASINEVAA